MAVSDFEAKENTFSAQVSVDNKKALLDLREKEEYLDQRRLWSYFIMGTIALLVLFTILLTIFVGLGLWHYDQWLIDIIYVSFFGSIVALATIVVNYLFPRPKALS